MGRRLSFGWRLVVALLPGSAAAAAAGRETSGSTRVVRFGFVLLFAAGTASVCALHYVTPTPRALAGLELEVESDGWTIVAGPLRGRPELHGVFALPPAGRRLELLEVRPGPADLGAYRPLQAVDGGLSSRSPPLRFRLELLGLGSWRSPRVLLDEQSTIARVLALDDRAIRILRNGSKDHGRSIRSGASSSCCPVAGKRSAPAGPRPATRERAASAGSTSKPWQSARRHSYPPRKAWS